MSFHLDVKGLRYFAAVARQGSFTQAAAQLHVTQPVVTRQVQSIERAYGVRLLLRESGRMVPTPAGEALLEHAEDIIARIDATDQLLKGAQADPAGKLAIGIPLSLGAASLTHAFGRFHRKFPRVVVQATAGNSTEFAYLLAQGKLDIALVYGRPAEKQLEFHPAARMPLGLVGQASQETRETDPFRGASRVSLREAASMPLILPAKGHALRNFIEASCRELGVTPHVIFESDGPAVSKELAANGHGYAILGLPSVREEIDGGRLRFVEIAGDIEPWFLSVATRRGKGQGAAVEAMVREILRAIQEGDQSGAPL